LLDELGTSGFPYTKVSSSNESLMLVFVLNLSLLFVCFNGAVLGFDLNSWFVSSD